MKAQHQCVRSLIRMMGVCGALALLVGLTTTPGTPARAAERADDEPLAATTRMALDSRANKVVPEDEVGRHVQRMDGSREHFFFEAERMNATATYMNLEWVNTRTGYPELYPSGLSTEEPRPVATRAPFLSGTGVAAILPNERESVLRQRLELNQGGEYVLWVRYQTIRQLPAPFELVIEQADEELLRQRFNEQSADLDVRTARLLWEATEPVELEPGEAVVSLVKIADENPGPLRGPRYVDCLLLTNDLDYIAGGGELLPSAPALQERRAALGVDEQRDVMLWHKGRYEGFFSTSWPTEPTQLAPRFEMDLPRRAHGHERLLVTSLSDEPITFEARVSLRDEAGEAFAGEAEVQVVTHMISRYFDMVPHTLFRRTRIELAPYHTVGLWLKVATGEAPPGDYRGEIELTRADETIGRTPVSVRVHERAVPAGDDLYIKLWGRPLPDGYDEAVVPEMEEKYWANALAHGWNVFTQAPPWPAAEARRRGVNAVRVTARSREEPGTDVFEREVRESLTDGVAAVRELGWEPEEIWIQAFDEPSAGSSERWLAHAEIITQMMPAVQMWTNPGWHRGQTVAAFEAWEPYVDIWWPYASNLSQPALLEVMKASDKPIGFYIERAWSGFNPGAAWAYFRRMPMLVAKYDLQGAGFWSASVYYRDPWDDLNTDINYSKAAVFYPGSHGPINTLNFAAWREGLDELLMLRALAADGEIDAETWAQRFLDVDSLEKQDALRRELIEQFVQ